MKILQITAVVFATYVANLQSLQYKFITRTSSGLHSKVLRPFVRLTLCDSSDSSFDSTNVDSGTTVEVNVDPVGVPSNEVATPTISVTDSVEATPSPFNLIGEQLKELQAGLEVFQSETYEQLYGKDLKWRLDDGDVQEIAKSSTPSKTAPAPTQSAPKPEVAALEPKLQIQDDSSEAKSVVIKPAGDMFKVEPLVAEKRPVPKITPIPLPDAFVTPKTGLTTNAGTVANQSEQPKTPEGIILMEVPIAEDKPSTVEDEKVAVLRAQQSIAKNFLSIGRSLSEVDLLKFNSPEAIAEVEAPAAEPVASEKSESNAASSNNIFGFFSNKPATVKPTAPVVVPPKVAAPPPAVESSPEPKATAAPSNIFGFFGSKPAEPAPVAVVVPEPVKAEQVPAKVVPPPVAQPAPAPQQFGGLLNFLQSDPNIVPVPPYKATVKATPPSRPVPVVASTPTPVKDTPPAVDKVPATPSTSSLFDFFTPKRSEKVEAAPVKVEAAVAKKVASVVDKPVPAKTDSTTAPASSGFFGFLSPSPAPTKLTIPAQTAAKSASIAAAEKKVEVAVAKKAVPEPPTPAASSGLFNFFAPSAQSAAPASPTDKTEIIAPAMATKKVSAPVKPAKTTASTASTPVSVPPAKTSAPAASAPASSGLFGFLSSSSPAPAKPPAPAQSTTKATPVVVVKKVETPVAKKAEAPVATAAKPAAASGNIFDFLTPKQAKPVNTTAAATKAVPVVAEKKVEAAAAKKAEAAPPTKALPSPPAKSTTASSGLFGFLSSTPALSSPPAPIKTSAVVEKKVEPVKPAASTVKPFTPWSFPSTSAPKESKAAVSIKPAEGPSMNAKYQLTASALLKKDPVKLRAFQKATDQYRSADLTSQQFLTSLESLFGKDDLESVVKPLIDGLPEKDSGLALKAAYEKKFSSASPSSGGLFGLFGASKPAAPAESVSPKSATPTTPLASTKPTPAKPAAASPPKTAVSTSSSPFGGFFGSSAKPAVSAAVATGVKITVPAKVPSNKKSYVEDQIKSLVSGNLDAKLFYTNLSKSLGKSATKEILPGILSQLSKDTSAKLSAVAAADK